MIRTKKAPLFQTGNYNGVQVGSQPANSHFDGGHCSRRVEDECILTTSMLGQAVSVSSGCSVSIQVRKMTIFHTVHKNWDHSLTYHLFLLPKSSSFIGFAELVSRMLSVSINQRRILCP